MYVKVYSRCRGEWEPIHVDELSRTELKREKRVWPNRLHLVITGKEAHRWVRDGGIHGTSLYIDADNQIRRAS